MANPTGLYFINQAFDYLGLADVQAVQMDNDSLQQHALTAINMLRSEIYDLNPGWGFLRSTYPLAVTAGTNAYNLTSLQSDLSFDNIYLEEVTLTTTSGEVSKIEHTERENYLNYLLPNKITTTYFYKNVDSSGNELFTLTVVPTANSTINIPYKKTLALDLTSTTITAPLEFPLKDRNMLVYGIAWWLSKRLKMDSDIIQRAEADYFRAKGLSTLQASIIQNGNRARVSPFMIKVARYSK